MLTLPYLSEQSTTVVIATTPNLNIKNPPRDLDMDWVWKVSITKIYPERKQNGE